MNANEISPKANARLNRIQKISRLLKVCVLLYFLTPLCVLAFNLKVFVIHAGVQRDFNLQSCLCQHFWTFPNRCMCSVATGTVY